MGFSINWGDVIGGVADYFLGGDDSGGNQQSAIAQQMAMATQALTSSRIFGKAKIPTRFTRDFQSTQSKLFELPGFAEKMRELQLLMGTNDVARRQLGFAIQEWRPGPTATSKIGLERLGQSVPRGPTIRI